MPFAFSHRLPPCHLTMDWQTTALYVFTFLAQVLVLGARLDDIWRRTPDPRRATWASLRASAGDHLAVCFVSYSLVQISLLVVSLTLRIHHTTDHKRSIPLIVYSGIDQIPSVRPGTGSFRPRLIVTPVCCTLRCGLRSPRSAIPGSGVCMPHLERGHAGNRDSCLRLRSGSIPCATHIWSDFPGTCCSGETLVSESRFQPPCLGQDRLAQCRCSLCGSAARVSPHIGPS